MCHSANSVITAIANTASAITGRSDRIVAATVTGARIRIANGFCRPAGQVEQDPELQEVVAEEKRGLALTEPGPDAAVEGDERG